MFEISHIEKHGGFWNGSTVVKKIETDNVEVAETFKAKEGYIVEEKTVYELDNMNVAQLKKYAKEHDIDLGRATQKADILKIIKE